MKYYKHYLDNFYRIKDVNTNIGLRYDIGDSSFNGNYTVIIIGAILFAVPFILYGLGQLVSLVNYLF